MKELRFISADLRSSVEVSGAKKLSGVVIRYGVRSTHPIAPGTYERIAPRAFKRSLEGSGDLRLLYEHEPANLLARTSAGNLQFRDTDEGLMFDAILPDTTLARDTYNQVVAGNIRGLSFGMIVNGDSYDYDELDDDGERCAVRTVSDAQLVEASLVSQPCYEQGVVMARNSFQLVAPEVRAAAHFKNEPKEKDIPRAQLLDRFRGEWV